MSNDVFLELWVADEIPACDVGMILLKGVYDTEDRAVFWNILRIYAGGVSHST